MAHKHSVVVKGEVEFFVKKPNHSFGAEIRDAKGQIITKLYGSINKAVYMTDTTIGELIDGERYGKAVKKTAKKASKKAEVVTKRAGRSVKGNVDVLAKNIANAFAQFGA